MEMENEQNVNRMKKNGMWMILGVVVLLVVIALVVMSKKDVSVVDEDINVSNTEVVVDAEDITNIKEEEKDVTEESVNTPTKAPALTYQQALEKYKDRRLQFNDRCQASAPNVVTYKDNTGIMLDNRSAETRTIKVGATYTIKPYGFKIITLPDIYRQPQKLLVDCDGQQNVATVLVQE